MTKQTQKRLAEGKNLGGRPLKKTVDCLPPDWQDKILNWCSQGWSEVEIRAALAMDGQKKFSHTLWYSLQTREKDFQETIKIGKALCEAWWTAQGRLGLHEKEFQTFLWFTNMKNRFGHNWRDKVGIEHSGSISWEGLYDDIAGAETKNIRQLQSFPNRPALRVL